MNILLFEDESIHNSFYPLSETKSVASLRCGILTLKEKWEKELRATVFVSSQPYLQSLYVACDSPIDLYIQSNVLPSVEFIGLVKALDDDEAICYQGEVLAYKKQGFSKQIEVSETIILNRPWDLLSNNGDEIEADIKRLGINPSIGTIQNSDVYKEEAVYIDGSANVKSAVINAEKGSVYIGSNVTVSEGCVLKGPLAVLDGAELTMGAKLRNANTIGPKSVVGGELKNVIFQGYSNKGHEGYLGDSFIGEWVNLGANTNGSNLKNNYSNIRMWDKGSGNYIDSTKWKLGAVIGDYVHTGISTMLNTGTTIGVGANVFGAGYQSKHIPNYAWGMPEETYDISKFIEMVKKLKSLKGSELSEAEEQVLRYLSK